MAGKPAAVLVILKTVLCTGWYVPYKSRLCFLRIGLDITIPELFQFRELMLKTVFLLVLL
jgi:hypothetical protein